ncbi:delta-aminolevulinic acid dehydratase [Cenarchaeum symbiosum A]|uniref:Delta-aminolevulinic acid dehydratase n=1 Tax=Cenarchaeum symbiosum (strain A) TaxID=414004 RepID=A0RXF7_CENSY|nr:delta-aminolevulinic acid dehydratase [Cenarchaeum symbiosum A]
MTFPAVRLRRLRRSEGMRALVRETSVSVDDLICPVFVQESGEQSSVGSMPGMERLPLSGLAAEIERISALGIRAVMLFGIPENKDDEGSAASQRDGIVQKAIPAVRDACKDMVIMADACLCHYTTSGHCGLVRDGIVDNDSSLAALSRIAVSLAGAGADVISPSAMMDGQVAAIRSALDSAGHSGVSTMPHSAKHSSAFYAPFRDAADCAPKFGDRRTYQTPYTGSREPIREVAADIEEGADIVMIKPALAYLDLIAETRRRFDVPVAAYSVSGEYALVKAASMQGWMREEDMVREILHSIKRAGADMIVTYFAKLAAGMIQNEGRRSI